MCTLMSGTDNADMAANTVIFFIMYISIIIASQRQVYTDTYQATKVSAMVSRQVKKANTIQYIIHFT